MTTSEVKTKPKIVQKRNPKYGIFLYVIFLPITYTLLIIFGQNILDSTNSYFETPFLDFGNYVLYLMLAYIILINKFYVQPWRKVDVEKQFEMLGYEFIIKERRILEKIQKIGFITIVVFFSILIVYGLPNSEIKNASINDVDSFILVFFAFSFGALVMTGTASVKMNVDNAKKQFRSYIAASFLQEAMNTTTDRLKIDYFNYGLQTYDIFFKKNHRQRIKNIQQIIIEIFSKNDSEKIGIIQDIIKSLKSNNNYSTLIVLAKSMGVKSHELLTPHTFSIQIKEWGLLIATIVITVFTVVLVFK
jgi:hypothetical protein